MNTKCSNLKDKIFSIEKLYRESQMNHNLDCKKKSEKKYSNDYDDYIENMYNKLTKN